MAEGDPRSEIAELRRRLMEAESALEAIREGEVDALVVGPSGSEQVFTLRGADQSYRDLVERMGDGALTLSEDGTILYANRAFAEIVGGSSLTIRGRRLHRFVAETHRARLEALLEQVVKRGGATGRVMLGTSPPIPVNLAGATMASDSDAAISFVVTDLRHLLEAQTTREALSAIVESSADAIVAAGPDGRIETWNAAASALFGHAAAEVIGLPVDVLFAPACIAALHDEVAEVLSTAGATYRFEATGVHASGADLELEVTVSTLPPPDGERPGSSWIARDVSSRKRLDRLRDGFVSAVSHELRTPIAGIIGALRILENDVIAPLPEACVKLVDLAMRNTHRLHRVVNDLLDMRQFENGLFELRFEALDLRRITGAAVEEYRPVARERGIDLALVQHDEALTVWADDDRLRQVLGKLLSNALKFSPPNSRVEVRTTMEGERACVAIDDEGPGVPPEFGMRVFEKFVQAEQPGAPRSGPGLGLSIARSITLRLGGELSFSGKTTPGTIFSVCLPLMESDE